MANILTLGTYYYPSSSSPQITTSFVLSWDETTNTSTNKSELNWKVTTSQSPTGSGYKRTLNSGSVTINGTPHNFSSGSVYNGLVIASGKDSVDHETDGTKTIAVSMTANLGGDNKSNNTTVTLSPIARATSFTLNTYSLNSSSSGVTITFTLVDGLTYQTRWTSSTGADGGWKNRTSSGYTWSLNSLRTAGYLVTSGVATLILELRTLSGSVVIGTTQATVIYTATDSGSIIPMSWEQEGSRFSVGFGKEAVLSNKTGNIIFQDKSVLQLSDIEAKGGVILGGASGGGSDGASGYVLAISMTALGEYGDAPFCFKVVQRECIYDLLLRFTTTGLQVSLNWGFYINHKGNPPTIIVNCSGSVANVYISKIGTWDQITVYPPFTQQIHGYGQYNILYPFTFTSTKPSGTTIGAG